MTLDGVANDGGESDNVGVDVEDIVGGSGNDSLVGNDSPNGLFGNGGNDTLIGNVNDDLLDGGVGTDSLVGGDGIDTASYTGRTENLVIVLDGIFNDGAAGENDKIAADVENVDGGDGNDSITGNLEGNQLFGGSGDDMLTGLAGGSGRPDGSGKRD